jgi:hypothetical protein
LEGLWLYKCDLHFVKINIIFYICLNWGTLLFVSSYCSYLTIMLTRSQSHLGSSEKIYVKYKYFHIFYELQWIAGEDTIFYYMYSIYLYLYLSHIIKIKFVAFKYFFGGFFFQKVIKFLFTWSSVFTICKLDFLLIFTRIKTFDNLFIESLDFDDSTLKRIVRFNYSVIYSSLLYFRHWHSHCAWKLFFKTFHKIYFSLFKFVIYYLTVEEFLILILLYTDREMFDRVLCRLEFMLSSSALFIFSNNSQHKNNKIKAKGERKQFACV